MLSHSVSVFFPGFWRKPNNYQYVCSVEIHTVFCRNFFTVEDNLDRGVLDNISCSVDISDTRRYMLQSRLAPCLEYA